MLKELNVLNGQLSLPFDPLNTRYTVMMNSDDNKLELDVLASDDYKISIYNNDIINNFTEVVITVYNDTDIMSYYLEVYKEENTTVNNSYDYFKELEINNDNEMPYYTAPLIASICFLLILFLFIILFKKRKFN